MEADPARADLSLTLNLAESGSVSLNLSIADPLEAGAWKRVASRFLQLSRYRTLVVGIETLDGVLMERWLSPARGRIPVSRGRWVCPILQVEWYRRAAGRTRWRSERRFAGDSARIEGYLEAERGD
ncbi:hypothetical protein DSL92_00025 [Billgrantia gudaonensis]|uniref:Uncharacterized protein n=1 Tax=Billgrantia gudaonensis TaxID=376427 RepID=A0A432JKZ1_9GAMM|nr:hypothetical protein DSL92_00025 [Halomonas gudaonensis]